MVAGTMDQAVGGRSDAATGAQIVEAYLAEWIEKSEPGIRRCAGGPFDVRWDYYSTVATD